jgi:hypothetical protein
MAFERWTVKLTHADGEPGRRELLAEIGAWRAAHLTDIPGLREAAFAMSQLYKMLGDHEAAVREARSLLSLCQTTPVATKEERQQAKAWLGGLGEKAPDLRLPNQPRTRGDRAERAGGRGAKKPADKSASGIDAALLAATKGDHDAALRMLKGKKGRGELARAWVRLSRALEMDDPAARDDALQGLDRWFQQVLRIRDLTGGAPVEAKKAAPPPPSEDDGPLAALLGRALPRRREARVRAMEAWLADHPGQADALAATALRAHLAESGKDVPAPWLVAFVARARLGESAQTDAAITELAQAGSNAVAVYDEWAFARAVAFARSAPERFAGLRRGVLGRKTEPDDRRVWTLRIDGEDRMLALVPAHDAPYPAEVAARVAKRLPSLCPRTVLLAPGAGNAPLREAVAAEGIVALDGDPSDTELVSALEAVKPVGPSKPAKAPRPEKPAKAEPKAPRATEARPPEPKPPEVDPREAFQQVLGADAAPTADALTEPVQALHKLRDAFLTADRLWSDGFPADASERLGVLMQVADQAAPDGLSVPEATTLALRVGAEQGGPAVDALTSGPTAKRFGGPGMADVVALVRAAKDAGWRVRRAFLGTTRRERRHSPVLSELSTALDGVWRLGLERGDGDARERRELWYVAELPIEGRAAVPQLLLEERERTVVLPIDPELMAWYGTLDAPDAIGWTPEDPSAVVDALA